MTPTAFREARRRLGLGTPRLAALLGVNPRTVRRWERGEQDIPRMAALLLAWLAYDERPQLPV